MDGTAELVLVLALIYLSDCVAWIRRGALALRSAGATSFRAALPSRAVGNARAGLVWSNPLPPLGTLFLSEPAPLGFAPDGVVTLEPLELQLGARVPFRPRAWSWDELDGLHARGRELVLGVDIVAVTSTARAAEHAAALVASLRTLAPDERAGAIERELARAFDPQAARTAVQRFDHETRAARIACSLLFSYCALAIPAVLALAGLARAWPWLLAGLVVAHTLAIWSAASARRRLRADERADRLSFLLSCALSPPQAIRALDLLARPMFATFHPLAAAALLAAPERERVARATAIDFRHPRRSGDGDARAESISSWFRARALAAAERCAAALALDWAQILRPPPAERESSESYCPRCHLQFELVDAMCPDCTCASAPLPASAFGGSRAFAA